MINPVSTPKGDAVVVVLTEPREDWTLIHVFFVIRVKSDEEEHCKARRGSLKRFVRKQGVQFFAWVRLVYD